MLLKEEAVIRERVRCIQKNISALLLALGEMAIANPIFTHLRLPLLVSTYCNDAKNAPYACPGLFDKLQTSDSTLFPPIIMPLRTVYAILQIPSTLQECNYLYLWPNNSCCLFYIVM